MTAGLTVAPLASTLRVLEPAEGVLAFYDGRVPGTRGWPSDGNWLDDGAYLLGVCAYALVDGDEALVFDTLISPVHGRAMRQVLEERGVRRITVALSHWHRDHIAGNEAFADCEIIAFNRTARMLEARRQVIEEGNPPIRPLMMPTREHDGFLSLRVGRTEAELRQLEIHSHDGTVLYLPQRRLLLAADTLEDSVTYVSEPERLSTHLAELERLAGWPVERILPSHGREEVIAAGGYGPGFISATQRYVERLDLARTDDALASLSLKDFAADLFADGDLSWFEPYEAVHRANVEAVRGGAVDE
ncbi:MBL fold metallo-hydrolase [Radicibacter daui]|uniref:MBL fold metallo-hydrolase n=1 Tax=Radicibacter daui TaxID=3064829 RepID=UPI004046E75A